MTYIDDDINSDDIWDEIDDIDIKTKISLNLKYKFNFFICT